jgi:hypothetical protein
MKHEDQEDFKIRVSEGCHAEHCEAPSGILSFASMSSHWILHFVQNDNPGLNAFHP